MSVFREFREFALKGNVIDLAVGVIIGAAFGAIVTSLVNDVMMPPLGYLTGGVDFAEMQFVLADAGEHPVTGNPMPAVVISYGRFINAAITFLIQAFAIFVLVKAINTARRQKEAEVSDTPKAPELTTSEQLLSEIRDALRQK